MRLEPAKPDPSKVIIVVTDGEPTAPKTGPLTKLASVFITYAPAGTSGNGVPILTLQPVLQESIMRGEAINAPYQTAHNIYKKAIQGESLDQLLRQEITQQLTHAGYSLKFDVLKPIAFPIDLLEQIHKGQAGIQMEYIERSITDTKGISLKLWQPDGSLFTNKQGRDLDHQLLALTWSEPADPQDFDPFDL